MSEPGTQSPRTSDDDLVILPPQFVPLDADHEHAAIAALIEMIAQFLAANPNAGLDDDAA